MKHPAALALSALVVMFGSSTIEAQSVSLSLRWPTGEDDPDEAIIALDSDDDDDDGVPDLLASPAPDPLTDDEVTLVQMRASGVGAIEVSVTGGLRIVGREGLAERAVVPLVRGVATIAVVGVAASRASSDAALVARAGAVSRTVRVTVVEGVFLRGDNTELRPHRDALGVSHGITNDATLPRSSAWADRSPDPENTRVEVWDPGAREATVRVESLATAASVGAGQGTLRGQLSGLAMRRPDEAAPWRSSFLRLVGDTVDLNAPGVQGQTLLVGLRDRVRLRYRREGAAGEITHDLRVGRPGNEDGPLAAREARWRVLVLRDRPQALGGRPVVGDDDAGALRIGRRQVAISNEVYLQCMVTFGDPERASVAVVDPPPPSLIAVGDDDGMRASGGIVRLRANGRAVSPVRVQPGWRPVDTAVAIASALRASGFAPRLTVNARTEYGAEPSADLVVRDREGRLVAVTPVHGSPLSTDTRQRVAIAEVDLRDGIAEFNNLNAASGTLEERGMIKALADDDPTTVDLFVINRFTRATRIGEAFVEGDRGAILNSLLLDRSGIAAEREAWTQSHEVGHILLDQPWHPDNMGPDRPWLLMDADASLGAVTGPKRLTAEECRRIHSESGIGATPGLLRRYDSRIPSVDAARYREWPGSPLHPSAPAVTEATSEANTAPARTTAPTAPSSASLGLRFQP